MNDKPKNDVSSRRLRGVVEAAKELICCGSLNELYRRGVELAREKLDVERAAIYIEEGDDVRGTFGTNLRGETTDEQGRCFAKHGFWCEVFGAPPQASPWTMIGDNKRYEWDGHEISVIGEGWVVKTPLVAADGKSVAVFFNDTAITNADCDPAQQDILAVYCSMLGGMIEHKRAEQALADEAIRRRILVEQSSDGIVVLDMEGKVFEANNRYAEMLGYTPEEVRNLYIWDWNKEFPREQLLGMLESVDEKGDHFETRHHRKGGTFYDVEISTNGATISGRKLIFCVCRDITARKQAEAKTEKQLVELRQWYAATLDREERILELKREVDELLRRHGEKPRYGIG